MAVIEEIGYKVGRRRRKPGTGSGRVGTGGETETRNEIFEGLWAPDCVLKSHYDLD